MIALSYTGVAPQSGGSLTAQGGPVDETLNELLVDVIGTLSGAYVAGGDALSFANLAGLAASIPGGAPSLVQVEEIQVIGTALTGFVFRYVWGPTLAAPTQNGGAIQIFGAGAVSGQGMTQLAAGAYAGTTPALTGVQLRIRAWFPKGT